MASKKISMQQIADAVGVSKYAVSKALAGQSGVSPQTRDKIIRMATDLGYFRQQQAAGAGGNREKSKEGATGPLARAAAKELPEDRRTVAVLMPEVRRQNMDSTFWSIVVKGIGEALARAGLGMLIITEQSAGEFSRVLRPEMLLGLIGVGEISSSMLLEVRRLGIPFVLTDHEDPLVPSDTVFAANMDSMARMANYLLALGHRSFWFLGDPGFSRSFADRWLGFRKALEDKGQQVDPARQRLELSGSFDPPNQELLARLLDQRLSPETAPPTAWVCANDEIALAALAELQKRGIQVPQQVTVTGFDNIAESGLAAVPLTTVNVAKESLGARAVAALLARIGLPDRPLEKISLACELIVRQSTGAAAESGSL